MQKSLTHTCKQTNERTNAEKSTYIWIRNEHLYCESGNKQGAVATQLVLLLWSSPSSSLLLLLLPQPPLLSQPQPPTTKNVIYFHLELCNWHHITIIWGLCFNSIVRCAVIVYCVRAVNSHTNPSTQHFRAHHHAHTFNVTSHNK